MTQVLVVDRTAFFGGEWPQGFLPLPEPKASAFLAEARARARFVDRPTAEANPAWKQWIPYCVLRCWPAMPGPIPREQAGVFTVRRTKGQSEQRLHGAWSIGLGGHIEPVDAAVPGAAPSAAAFFARALRRELAEELDWQMVPVPEARFVGLLNDDSTEVGAVHAGLVYVVDLPVAVAAARELVRIGEISKMHGAFTSLAEFANLWQNPQHFETWSQILVRAGISDPVGSSANQSCGSGG